MPPENNSPAPQPTAPQTPVTPPPASQTPIAPAPQTPVDMAKKAAPKIAKIGLIAFGVFMVVMAIFIFVVVKFTNNATSDAVAVSDQMVNSIQADDANTAYSLASTTFKDSSSEADTEKLISGLSPLLQGEEKITGKKIQTSDGKTYSAIVYSIDDKVYVRVVLEKEGSDWKVLNFRSSDTPLEAIVE